MCGCAAEYYEAGGMRKQIHHGDTEAGIGFEEDSTRAMLRCR
jgi:hypothetical protein